MIISCGEALVDLVPHAVPGGGPMNVAVTAARQGASAAFLGRVSTDHHGDAIWAHMQQNGVVLDAAQRGPEPTATAAVDPGPPLRFRFEGENTADQALSEADLSGLPNEPHVLHGGTLGLFRGRSAEVVADLAETTSGVVSLDPNIRPQLIDDRDRWGHFHNRWASVASIYKGSDEDLEWVWPRRSPSAIAEELLARGVALVAVTKGPDGAVLFHRSGEINVSGVKVDVVDTVGAGDAFIGSLLASIVGLDPAVSPDAVAALSPVDLEQIGRRAIMCAAMTCAREGADPPTGEEVDAALGGA